LPRDGRAAGSVEVGIDQVEGRRAVPGGVELEAAQVHRERRAALLYIRLGLRVADRDITAVAAVGVGDAVEALGRLRPVDVIGAGALDG